MSSRPLAAVVLAAGRGERMNSDLPKVLHEVAGKPLLAHVLETLSETGISRRLVVVGSGAKEVRSFLGKVETVSQNKQLGTAHAVLQVERKFRSWRGDLLVVPADAPCLRAETLRGLLRAHRANGHVATILTADVENPKGYGRLLRRGKTVVGIREELDASKRERKIREVNSGVYLFDARQLFHRLREVRKNSKKKEYYLTDVIESLSSSGATVAAHKISNGKEIIGVNTRRHLARVHQVMTERELDRHAKNGVTILNPSQTHVAVGAKIGRDTVIHPFSWIDRDVVIGRHCEIGPSAKIRAGSRIGDGSAIGSFVEIVRSRIGARTRVKHLCYLGDASVGNGVNVGAGTITANYDGHKKNKTVIHDRVFIGVNTMLIAPVTIGRGAKTGAGAVVLARTKVLPGSTVVGVPARAISRKKKRKK